MWTCLLPLALAGSACVADDGDADADGADEGAIANGTREEGRVPVASYGTVCTATFVSRARCLITAAHCSGGSLQMGPDVNVGLSDPRLKTTFSARSLSLRDSTPLPRYAGGSFDWSPADDIKILWASASASPGPRTVDHRSDYRPIPLDFSTPVRNDPYTIHGYGFNVCDETGDGVLRYGFFRGGNVTNSTGGAIPGVRVASTPTLLRLSGSNGRYGICQGDSGASVRSNLGVRGVIGWSLNGSNDGYATTLAPYRPWFERNVLGAGARFCNPSWPVVVRGPGAVDLAIEGGVVARHRTTGGDVNPWDANAIESAGATGLAATNGAAVRVRGNDPLAPVRLRVTTRANVTWPAGQCVESTSTTCTVTLDPTVEDRTELTFAAAP
ncbi:MAG: trypsin-like serine protease [Labilithrix sp.]|nr:trypsin-like serine protease [Labilithrix sp.]MCW5813122.1 trypsin-like serine protease [Labilithrix sp.]